MNGSKGASDLGGKPSRNTPKDGRLKENGGGKTATPAPVQKATKKAGGKS